MQENTILPKEATTYDGSWKAQTLSVPTLKPSQHYWENIFKNIEIPEIIRRLMPLLSWSDIQSLKNMLEWDNILESNKIIAEQFCKLVGIWCGNPIFSDLELNPALALDQNTLVQNAIDAQTSFPGNISPRERMVWFYEKDMVANVGTQDAYKVPAVKFSLADKILVPRKLLPRALTRVFQSLSKKNALNVLKQLHIPKNSTLGESTIEAFEMCEKLSAESKGTLHPALKRECVTSFEEMVDFLNSIVPQGREVMKIDAWSTTMLEPSTHIDEDDHFLVRSVTSKMTMQNIIVANCHAPISPFMIDLCHHMDDVRAYHVTLQLMTQKTKTISTVAMCHLDTRNWNPNHLAFKILGGKPSLEPLCHWAEPDDIQFVIYLKYGQN